MECRRGPCKIVLEQRSEDSPPSEAEVREVLSGNICRCTGYQTIVDAVMAVLNPGGATT